MQASQEDRRRSEICFSLDRLDKRHWSSVYLPGVGKVIRKRDQHDTGEYHRGPVHRLDRHRPRQREEDKDPHNREEAHGDRFNSGRELAQAPARRGQGFTAPPLEAQTEDGYSVGKDKGSDAEGDDGVEGDGGTEVDEGHETDDHEAHVESVERDGPSLVDLD